VRSPEPIGAPTKNAYRCGRDIGDPDGPVTTDDPVEIAQGCQIFWGKKLD
jgi:hypothetical protein